MTSTTGSRTSLRSVSQRFASGVAVLTSGDAPDLHGVTVSTVAIASFEPPMVSVALRRRSRGLAALRRCRSFVVNGLGGHQEELARDFARPDRGVAGIERQAAGPPRLTGAAWWLDCLLVTAIPVGDHELLLSRVLHATCGTGSPLLTYAGGLHTLPLHRTNTGNRI